MKATVEQSIELFNVNKPISDKNWEIISPTIIKALEATNVIDMDDLVSPEDIDADRNCGIDKTMEINGKQVTMALRIQPSNVDWRTFSIRKSTVSGLPTEFYKRRKAIKSGDESKYPKITAQVYIVNNQISYAIIRTKDLYDFIEQNPELIQTRTNRQDGNKFVVVYWADLIHQGFKFVTNMDY